MKYIETFWVQSLRVQSRAQFRLMNIRKSIQCWERFWYIRNMDNFIVPFVPSSPVLQWLLWVLAHPEMKGNHVYYTGLEQNLSKIKSGHENPSGQVTGRSHRIFHLYCPVLASQAIWNFLNSLPSNTNSVSTFIHCTANKLVSFSTVSRFRFFNPILQFFLIINKSLHQVSEYIFQQRSVQKLIFSFLQLKGPSQTTYFAVSINFGGEKIDLFCKECSL